jgi:hypothetical protein
VLNNESNCRWCGSGALKNRAYSAKARWIVENPKNSDISNLLECEECALLYFDGCYSVFELERMYGGYRGMSYFKQRNRYEPWYTKRINSAIGHSVEVLRLRRDHLENLLSSFSSNDERSKSITRVLDIGGDEGQFIPELDSITDRAVLEISGVNISSDIQLFESWSEARGYDPDLVMICHVLEHLENPREYLVETANICRSGSFLYVEVPLDRPERISSKFSKQGYKKYLTFLCRHPNIFIFADLLSLVSRRFLGRPIIGSAIKKSEHVNYFSAESIYQVITAMGFVEEARSVYVASSGVPVLDVSALGMLFRRN